MPFKSAAQKKLFDAVSHGMKARSPSAPKKKVAKKFVKDSADMGQMAEQDRKVQKKMFGKKPLGSADKIKPKRRGGS